MVLSSKVFVLLIFFIFFYSLVCRTTFGLTNDEMAETHCLRSIKTSLEDPLKRLKWSFDAITASSVCSFVGVTCWSIDGSTIKILNINLTNMELKGQFPRGLKDCSSLQSLDLSGNHLSGPIPQDIDQISPYLVELDLSNNSFSGEIPSAIADLSYLNILLLDINQLTGQIPPRISWLQRLRKFSVSNNILSGPVPDFAVAVVPKESYTNNKGLCGGPLKPCGNHGNPLKFDLSFTSGFVLGYVTSVVSVITIFLSYCVPWLHVKKIIISRWRTQSKRTVADRVSKSPPRLPSLQDKCKKIHPWEEQITSLKLEDIKKATNNFSQNNVIGTGQTGTVYKATLPSGEFVAVKKFHYVRSLGEQFMFELKTLVKLRQQINIVGLRGFCVESMERFLVYEYLSNGNLYEWLHPTEDGPSHRLEWPSRVKIATGVARALVSLNNFGIFHFDVSSKCILIDQNLEPKLSNLKQAMQSAFNKEDVYSFGLVLLELISGKEPSTIEISHLSERFSMYSDDAIDKSLIGKGFDGEIFLFLRVACQCVEESSDQRPTMLQVYKKLCGVAKSYGLVDTPEIMIMPAEITAPAAGDECVEVDEITEVPY